MSAGSVFGPPLGERDDFGARIESPADFCLGMVRSIVLLEPENSRRLMGHHRFFPF